MQIGEGMTNKRDCENCVHAHPFGGENDNRCDAWECEYINRQEAIEAYKARRDDTEWEWCRDCKEYDQEAHCCHRWTKVIRNTVEDVKESYKIVTCGECKYWHEGKWYNTCDKHIGHGFMAEHFCSYGERSE